MKKTSFYESINKYISDETIKKFKDEELEERIKLHKKNYEDHRIRVFQEKVAVFLEEKHDNVKASYERLETAYKEELETKIINQETLQKLMLPARKKCRSQECEQIFKEKVAALLEEKDDNVKASYERLNVEHEKERVSSIINSDSLEKLMAPSRQKYEQYQEILAEKEKIMLRKTIKELHSKYQTCTRQEKELKNLYGSLKDPKAAIQKNYVRKNPR